MSLFNTSIVTPARIDKALRIGFNGQVAVERLARWVGVQGTDPYTIFCACEKPRAQELADRGRYVNQLYATVPEMKNRRRR